ncbi:MAG: sugar kinase [Armatimonadota bacterium]|nr:sugar kinase [Armatimonadota bacterium]
MLDVVTLGEAMIRLAAPYGEALESAPHLEARVAGAEANVAVTLARLGFRSGWISKLVDDPLGRRIVGELRRHGVDVSAMVWTSQGRTGLYFIEHVPPPRGVAVHYDRTGSACSTMTPEEVDWAYVRSARRVHVTGITPALSASCARTTARLLDEARACGAEVSFDVNYRRKLWTAQQARAVLEPLLDGVELVIATQEDAREVFGLAGTPPDLAARLRDHTHAAAAVITAGAGGAYLADGQTVHHEPAVPGAEVDPIGRGDAFAAGLLWAALEADLVAGLRYGVALASLAQAYRGDIPWVTRQDVLRALEGRDTKPAR